MGKSAGPSPAKKPALQPLSVPLSWPSNFHYPFSFQSTPKIHGFGFQGSDMPTLPGM